MKLIQANRVIALGLWLILSSTLSYVNAQQTTIQTDVPAIKDVYKNDFYFGCLLSYTYIGFSSDPFVPGQSAVTDPNGGYLIQYHMNSMSPGNWLKPVYIVDLNASAAAYNSAATQAEKDSADVHPVITFNGNIIAQLNWAQRQGFTFRGHTLVWHNQTPGTAFFRSGFTASGTRLTKEKMTARLENYIKEVIRTLHEGWPGLLSAYDVVNEAINDNGTDRDSSTSEWFQTFKDNSYIMKAFEFARKYTTQYGETQIKLYYNDYNTSTPAKADGIVRLLTPIYQAGYLDGIGMQEHDQYNSPTAAAWIATYNKFYPICSEMSVTELDVKPSSNTLTNSVLTQQANEYGLLFKCFVERSFFSGRGKLISVSKDGLNDAHAFVANASLWDGNDQCKPAFYSAVNVGIYYNKLDSLITYSNNLKESDYTAQSWSNFSLAFTNAKDAKDKQYSYTNSAPDSLMNAYNALHTAMVNLVDASTSIKDNNRIPKDFILDQNYPNPFNPSTQINYSVPQNGYISLKVYNLLGEKVATLFEGYRQPGYYSVTFNGSGLASGVYLYQLKAENYIATNKFILLK